MSIVLTANEGEIDLGKELHPDGEVTEACWAVAEFSPHVEPVVQADGDLGGDLGSHGLVPAVDHVGCGAGVWREKEREIKNANKIFHNCNLQNISIFWGGENTGGASFKEIYANHI